MRDDTAMTDPLLEAAAQAIKSIEDAVQQGTQRALPRHKLIEEFYDPESNLVMVERWESQIPNRRETPIRLTINSGLTHDDSDLWLDDEQAAVLALALLRAMKKPGPKELQARMLLRRSLPKRVDE